MSGTGAIISQTIAHLPEKEPGSISTVDYSSIRGKVDAAIYLSRALSALIKYFVDYASLYMYVYINFRTSWSVHPKISMNSY